MGFRTPLKKAGNFLGGLRGHWEGSAPWIPMIEAVWRLFPREIEVNLYTSSAKKTML